MSDSISLQLARELLGKKVVVSIDRPLGSTHPKHGYVYEVNYGHIAGVTAPDGEDLDAYVLGIAGPVNSFEGIVVAIVHRHDDDDDKLIVLKEGAVISDGEIEDAVAFQEKWFLHKILRA